MLQALFIVAIFLSAFLLFFVQPVLAKYMIPQFGGSSFVWITSLLFFQTALLIGYSYAYLLTKFFSEKKQAIIHFTLLLCSCYFIPIHVDAIPVFDKVWPPLSVIHLLAASILLPFIVLSASSPLLQHWYCTLKKTDYPYFYYSISNAGSLLGLLGYPLLIEPFIGTHTQSIVCSVIYVMYIVLCALCLFRLRSSKPITPNSIEETVPIQLGMLARWLSLAFLTSALLLATTQFLAQNVINAPLIWIMPLAVYLISFISTFSTPKGYERGFWLPIFCTFILLNLKNIYFLTLNGIQVVIFIVGLFFSACIICHGELIRLKPKQKDLTLFYLIIALGSVLGSLFANGLSLLFTQWWNFYLPLTAINLLVILISFRRYQKDKTKMNLAINLFSAATLFMLFTVLWIDENAPPGKKLVMQQRNLYGLLRVYDVAVKRGGSYRILMHGTVMHGLQYLDPKKQLRPTTYYGLSSGASLAIQFMHQATQRPLQIAVIGLGTGTIAALANPGDHLTFYEIDPDVAEIAHQYFHFLEKAPTISTVVIGDARIELVKNTKIHARPQYDVIIIDAFNGDAIPFHLITNEATTLYRSLLNPQGIIAFHTSNRFINLMPVTAGLAQQQACAHYWFNSETTKVNTINTTWAMISCNEKLGGWLAHQQGVKLVPNEGIKPLLWTDDFNSILPILNIQ